MSLNKLQEIVRTGKPGTLQSMGLQRVGHDLVTEQQRKTRIIAHKPPEIPQMVNFEALLI